MSRTSRKSGGTLLSRQSLHIVSELSKSLACDPRDKRVDALLTIAVLARELRKGTSDFVVASSQSWDMRIVRAARLAHLEIDKLSESLKLAELPREDAA